MSLIELRNVSKDYQMGEVLVKALDKVNLKIDKKDFVSIMGPSGSGKSTILNMIGLLDKPTSGKIFLNNTDISQLRSSELAKLRRDNIGFIFQFFNLYPSLSAFQNVELPMIISDMDSDERKNRALELLNKVGLKERVNHLPSQMSGGEIQRVSIARAMSNNPDIILADEPTGNLDTKTGKEITDILRKLNKEFGVTLILITHEKFISKVAERIIYLKDGKIIKEDKK